jgi:hypothetical protein
MLCAYLSIDQVNQAIARRLAKATRVELLPLSFQNADLCGPYDAIVYDLDFMPPDCRQRLLNDLAGGRFDEPAAVHGYNLTLRQRLQLHRRGVVVARRLTGRLFARLQDAVNAVAGDASAVETPS